jgi:hypothetical protein
LIGQIDVSELISPPESLEFETAKYFAALGKNVVFILPSHIPNQHSPDIKMDGVEWEIKCPVGKSKRTLENNMRKALKQSRNIIFDLRHLKLSEKSSINQLENEFKNRTRIKKLLIIKKDGELIEFKR